MHAQNIYAEMTLVCPSYWLANAFSDQGRSAWKYQYSVPGAMHGADSVVYFGGMGESLNIAIDQAVMRKLFFRACFPPFLPAAWGEEFYMLRL